MCLSRRGSNLEQRRVAQVGEAVREEMRRGIICLSAPRNALDVSMSAQARRRDGPYTKARLADISEMRAESYGSTRRPGQSKRLKAAMLLSITILSGLTGDTTFNPTFFKYDPG